MMDSILNFGLWGWIALGLVLLFLEMILPGVMLLWLGLAAIATGLLCLLLPIDPSFQALIFAGLSVVAFMLWRLVSGKKGHDVNSADDLIGRSCVVVEAIRNGHGRVRIGDGTWSATGPDTDIGVTVKVVRINGATLDVTPL